ncbi:hypothetical protein D9M71_674930 [compost metagenome]
MFYAVRLTEGNGLKVSLMQLQRLFGLQNVAVVDPHAESLLLGNLVKLKVATVTRQHAAFAVAQGHGYRHGLEHLVELRFIQLAGNGMRSRRLWGDPDQHALAPGDLQQLGQ